jgi:cytoplasmic tRNA 2-thiolation protein 1
MDIYCKERVLSSLTNYLIFLKAYRGYARAFIKDLEAIRPRAIIDIILSGENLSIKKDAKLPVQGICERCGYISSMTLCNTF